MATFEDVQKIELKIGTVLAAESIVGSEKLLKLSVDVGEAKLRTVVSGIAKTFAPEKLINKQFIFVTNLDPRMIMGLESQAMILATHKPSRSLGDEIILIKPTKKVSPGSKLG